MSGKSVWDGGLGSELERFILHYSQLQPGDKLEGKVIKARSDNRILIDFGSFRALADAQFEIREGQVINVVVIARSPKLKLRLETPRTGMSSGARQVIRNMEMAPEDRWSNISGTIDRLLSLENTGRVGEWLFPPGIRESLDEVNPYARFRQLQPGKVAVLLHLGLLGNVRADFHLLGKNLNITFYASREGTAISLDGHLDYIREKAAPFFDHLVLNVFQSERKISEFDIESLDIPVLNQKMLDVKI